MRVYFTVVLVITNLVIYAQQRPLQTVNLKDGSQIQGIVVLDSADVIKFKVVSPQVITINRNQISTIEAYTKPVQSFQSNGGYYMNASSGILAGENSYGGAYSFSVQLSNGYWFKDGLMVGLGTGIEHLGVPLMPLFADFAIHPLEQRVSPSIYLRAGYGFALGASEEYYSSYYSNASDAKGGLLLNAGIGVTMFTHENVAVNIGLGYRYQRVTEYFENYWWSTIREVTTDFNRIEIKLGLLFM
jgi:hypothetical protein